MLAKSFLDEVLALLNKDAGIYAEPSYALRQIQTADDVPHCFLRFIETGIHFSSLPLAHDEIPYYIQNDAGYHQYISEIEYLVLRTNHLLFKGIAYEYLWNVEHRLEYATSAIATYLELLPTLNGHTTRFCTIACSICRVFQRCRTVIFDQQHFWELCKDSIIVHMDSQGFCTLYILLGLLECEINPEAAEQLLIESISHFEEQQLYEKAISFREDLISYYKKKKRPCSHLIVDNAVDYEKAARQLDINNPGNSFRIIDLVQKAMLAWQRSKSPEAKNNRERLARFINPVKESMIQNMAEFESPPIDISDTVQMIKERIENSSFEEAIAHIANAISPREMDYFKKSDDSYFSSLFPMRLLDNKGRIRANIPSRTSDNPDDRRKTAQYEAMQYYRLSAEVLLMRYLYFSKEKFDFNENSLRFLVENNLFIPDDRKETYLKGILAGFSGDWGTAMHLLMPQVENSIRNLAEACDIVVYKTNEFGVEECLSLTAILALPEFKEYFEDDLIFCMELFYTSEYGFGMRDQISHGLLSDNQLQSYDSMAVWGFTFNLCCQYSRELGIRLARRREDFSPDNN